MTDDDRMFKEIELLENCINRMSNNSFMCKGWTITLLVAIIGLFYQSNGALAIILSIIQLTCFWIMDSKYLQLEQTYRIRYSWIITNRPLNNYEGIFELNPKSFGINIIGEKKTLKQIMFSWSEFVYIVALIFVIALAIYSIFFS